MPATDELVNADAAAPEGDFYVTVQDGGRTGFLLGPYEDMRDALRDVQRGRDFACKHNPPAVFSTYGVSRLARGTAVRTVFQSCGCQVGQHNTTCAAIYGMAA